MTYCPWQLLVSLCQWNKLFWKWRNKTLYANELTLWWNDSSICWYFTNCWKIRKKWLPLQLVPHKNRWCTKSRDSSCFEEEMTDGLHTDIIFVLPIYPSLIDPLYTLQWTLHNYSSQSLNIQTFVLITGTFTSSWRDKTDMKDHLKQEIEIRDKKTNVIGGQY